MRRPIDRWDRRRRFAFGSETMLQRVVRLLDGGFPSVVVAAAEQSLPDRRPRLLLPAMKEKGADRLKGCAPV